MDMKFQIEIQLSHLRMLLFGEGLARHGVGDAMDIILRNHQLWTDFFFLAQEKASWQRELPHYFMTERVSQLLYWLTFFYDRAGLNPQ